MPGWRRGSALSGVILYTQSMGDSHFPRVDRTKLTIANLSDPPDELEYWRSKSYLERLEAIELSRLAIYGHDPVTTRLQRLLEVTQLSRS